LDVLIAYDVATETKEGQRRLRRVAQVCKDFGQRVQKSVFECTVSEMQFVLLRRRLLDCISAPRSLTMEWEEIPVGSIREPMSRWG
jgi:CRISPR-associated endonuclease Cas2